MPFEFQTVLTDYPDNDLIDNLRFNVHENVATYGSEARAVVLGYIWGTPVTDLLGVADAPDGFDLIILSDLIFNHSQVSSSYLCSIFAVRL